MIELGNYARDGRLRQFLDQPWMQARNGVDGISLFYDDRLVREARRTLRRSWHDEWLGTLEQSRDLAMTLAAVAARFEGFGGREIPDRAWPAYLADQLGDWWDWLTDRSGVRKLSPIQVELTVNAEFEYLRGPGPDFSFDYPYRLSVRRPKRRAQLQAAAAGGRIHPLVGRPHFGTTGGFVRDDFGGQLWSMTAAHVCGDQPARARALPWSRTPALLRGYAGSALSALGFPRYRPEDCTPRWSSWPMAAPMPHCTVATLPTIDGLDMALHAVRPQARLTPVEVVNLADVSPDLDLSFSGVTSGRTRVKVASYSVWHSYSFGGQEHCVHDCLLVRPASRPYLRTNLSSGGDSGAWLLAHDQDQHHWAGMLIGGDGDRTGFAPASRIIYAIERELRAPVSAHI